ncbi:MAG: hypothetical protein L0Z70_14815 [Chloroflexi bacterium]|nr:hypothetical protein [Chloroflexota bacterium]
MKTTELYYMSYLLRIWREGSHGEWRASLQNIATGECLSYASPSDLFEYLKSQFETTIHPKPVLKAAGEINLVAR